MKPNYFLIPLFTIIIAFGGSRVTSMGMAWYRSMQLPSWTPPGSLIGLVWTVIFILATIAALLFYNQSRLGLRLTAVISLFILNGLLNFLWSYLFFGQHLIGAAVLEAAGLALSVLILIILIWPVSKVASALLLPYLGWVSFATYLTYSVWLLNK